MFNAGRWKNISLYYQLKPITAFVGFLDNSAEF